MSTSSAVLENMQKYVKQLRTDSLADLIRGLRSNKGSESAFVTKALNELKVELNSNDMTIKTVAVQKLVYLQMMGYDISWAAFRIVEVMSQSKFGPKRAGYLAASQSFHEGTEVTMLVTNLLRKDFHSGNQYEAGVALATLSIIATPDLARDLAPDLLMLLTSSRPYVKKRATLCLYRVFLRYPEALRPSFPKLREKLVDDDPAVVSAACNVVCELARTAPANYLPLAPVFFRILTESSNNWLLIRIVKLLAELAPAEKRLAKKLIDPLTTLINSTPAMSLMYECIQTSIAGCAHHVPLMKLCIAKLRLFIEDTDQNLKYLGLVALGGILKVHPKAVAEHRDVILACLDDDDSTIRLRALSLLPGLVTSKNLHSLVQKLMQHALRAEPGDFLDELVRTTIRLCSANGYELVTDFEWYFSVLVELTRLDATRAGDLIAAQMYDVACRVVDIRPAAADRCGELLRVRRRSLAESSTAGGVCEALGAAAFIVGEYGTSDGALVSAPREVLDALLDESNVSLPPHVAAVLLAAGLKVAVALAACSTASASHDDANTVTEGGVDVEVREVFRAAGEACAAFATSVHAEVQERATGFAAFAAVVAGDADGDGDDDGDGDGAVEVDEDESRQAREATVTELIAAARALFTADLLGPVSLTAQSKVAPPSELDLTLQIGEDIPADDDEDDDDLFATLDGDGGSSSSSSVYTSFPATEFSATSARPSGQHAPSMSAEDRQRAEREAEARRAERAANPFYIPSSSSSSSTPSSPALMLPDLTADEDPSSSSASSASTATPTPMPLSPADLGGIHLVVDKPPAAAFAAISAPRSRTKATVLADEDVPGGSDGVTASPSSPVPSSPSPGASSSLGAIDLSTPLRHDEILRLPQHRETKTDAERQAEARRARTASTRGTAGRGRGRGRGRGGKSRPAPGGGTAGPASVAELLALPAVEVSPTLTVRHSLATNAAKPGKFLLSLVLTLSGELAQTIASLGDDDAAVTAAVNPTVAEAHPLLALVGTPKVRAERAATEEAGEGRVVLSVRGLLSCHVTPPVPLSLLVDLAPLPLLLCSTTTFALPLPATSFLAQQPAASPDALATVLNLPLATAHGASDDAVPTPAHFRTIVARVCDVLSLTLVSRAAPGEGGSKQAVALCLGCVAVGEGEPVAVAVKGSPAGWSIDVKATDMLFAELLVRVVREAVQVEV